MRPLVIVPARVGSHGVPRKNFRRLPDGTTLIDRAVAVGQQIGEVVVTTDHPTWRPRCRDVQVISRPPQFATSHARIQDVIAHVATTMGLRAYSRRMHILLQPTTLRTAARVRTAIATFREVHHPPHDEMGVATAYKCRVMREMSGDVRQLPPPRQLSDEHAIATGEAYVWGITWPSLWYCDYSDRLPINVDTPSDWRALCQEIRRRQAVTPRRGR